MSSTLRKTAFSALLFGAATLSSMLAFSTNAQADVTATTAPAKVMIGTHAKTGVGAKGDASWCAPEIEALPNDVCYLDGSNGNSKKSASTEKRTLIVFLHGAIAKNTTWSWNHERMILRVAKAHGVEVIFPKSPQTEAGFVWPGTAQSQEAKEEALIDQWMGAKKVLEQRDGNKPFDEVFIMGFSSGAYFTSSLALRGRVNVDGYAVFCGGQPAPAPASPVTRRSAVFVGVCGADETTAAHSRAYAGSLTAANIPRMVLDRHVGHGLDHAHFAGALAYLRSMNKPRIG